MQHSTEQSQQNIVLQWHDVLKLIMRQTYRTATPSKKKTLIFLQETPTTLFDFVYIPLPKQQNVHPDQNMFLALASERNDAAT